MNIAYCFSGHVRTGMQNASLAEYLVMRQPGDIFVHTYKKRNNPGPQWHNDHDGQDEDIDSRYMIDLMSRYGNSKSCTIDHAYGGSFYMPSGCERMGYRHSMAESYRLMLSYSAQENKKYDVVFMTRFDFAPYEPLVIPGSIEENTIYGSYNLNQIQRGNDSEVFWYGDMESVGKMLIPVIPKEELPLIPEYEFTGEMLFTSIRKRNGLKYKTHEPIMCGLIRSWGMLEIEI